MLLSAVLVVLLLCGCTGERPVVLAARADGDPDLGKKLLYSYGCGSCHIVPGVAEAEGTVGPPLGSVGSQSYIAGSLPNTPENMIRWLVAPQKIEPDSAMPDLGVTPAQARHIAAYLYSLR